MEMEKLKKTAVVIDTILKVVSIIVIVGMVILLISDVLLLAIGPMNIENGDLTYRIGGVNIHLADGVDNETIEEYGLDSFALSGYQFVKSFLMASAGGIVGMAVVLVGIKMLREIIAPMKVGGPFVEGISLKMRNFGIFVLIAGVIGGAVQFAMSMVVQEIYNSVMVQEYITRDVMVENVIDGSFIVFALFIFLLSYIFKYGEELQKQSDETL